MNIGVLKEIKVQEHRVALTPNSTRVLVEAGHLRVGAKGHLRASVQCGRGRRCRPRARLPGTMTRDRIHGPDHAAGSVIVDVSNDQGACVETSPPTSHADPVFVAYGVSHYGVANMPGAYPRTSTIVLTGATLPYALRLANHRVDALRRDSGFGKGPSTYEGRITSEAVASALGMTDRFRPLSELWQGQKPRGPGGIPSQAFSSRGTTCPQP
jgi:alanine dehydrogenase